MHLIQGCQGEGQESRDGRARLRRLLLEGGEVPTGGVKEVDGLFCQPQPPASLIHLPLFHELVHKPFNHELRLSSSPRTCDAEKWCRMMSGRMGGRSGRAEWSGSGAAWRASRSALRRRRSVCPSATLAGPAWRARATRAGRPERSATAAHVTSPSASRRSTTVSSLKGSGKWGPSLRTTLVLASPVQLWGGEDGF